MIGDFFSLLAHISKDEDREVSQYLAEHLVDTALYAESRGKELGVGNICALILVGIIRPMADTVY